MAKRGVERARADVRPLGQLVRAGEHQDGAVEDRLALSGDQRARIRRQRAARHVEDARAELGGHGGDQRTLAGAARAAHDGDRAGAVLDVVPQRRARRARQLGRDQQITRRRGREAREPGDVLAEVVHAVRQIHDPIRDPQAAAEPRPAAIADLDQPVAKQPTARPELDREPIAQRRHAVHEGIQQLERETVAVAARGANLR